MTIKYYGPDLRTWNSRNAAWWGYVGAVTLCLKLTSYLRRQSGDSRDCLRNAFSERGRSYTVLLKRVLCFEYLHCVWFSLYWVPHKSVSSAGQNVFIFQLWRSLSFEWNVRSIVAIMSFTIAGIELKVVSETWHFIYRRSTISCMASCLSQKSFPAYFLWLFWRITNTKKHTTLFVLL